MKREAISQDSEVGVLPLRMRREIQVVRGEMGGFGRVDSLVCPFLYSFNRYNHRK